jgi:proline iminopeptidase
VEGPGSRLAVYLDGVGEDPVVLLHGGPGVPDYLAPVANILASRHRVVRYDQRGTGRSTAGTGRFDLKDQVQDLEAIRAALGFERMSLFGHSWGGTLGQLYVRAHPDRVTRLFLCNSGIGLGEDWKRMERAVMRHNRSRAGVGGFALLGVYQVISMLPGAMGDAGARRLMARVWRNYFDPPSSAPEPDAEWLAGVHAEAIHSTRNAALHAGAHELTDAPPGLAVAVVFGERDIYGSTTNDLFARYPRGRHVVLPDCGHVPWLQNSRAFRDELCGFFDC